MIYNNFFGVNERFYDYKIDVNTYQTYFLSFGR